MAIKDEATGRMICGAKTKNGPCRNYPMTNGSGRCRLHGGKSLRGLASPTFKTGRYSKFLPARLQERFVASQEDAELLSLRSEISMLDARIEDLLSRVDTGEAGEIWKMAKSAFSGLKVAVRQLDTVKIATALDEIETLINGGYNDFSCWREIGEAVELRRKLVESERKRLMEMNQIITAEQATILLTTILDVIRRKVNDRKILNDIQDEFIRLFQVSVSD